MSDLTKTQAKARVAAAEEAVARFAEDADPGDYSSDSDAEWRRTPYGDALWALDHRRQQLAALG